ncbi:MAG: hypothetical protein H2056_05215, partial [Sphingopyxis sp.]|nr:hypothetical protein [Sphingopyxis sp.]
MMPLTAALMNGASVYPLAADVLVMEAFLAEPDAFRRARRAARREPPPVRLEMPQLAAAFQTAPPAEAPPAHIVRDDPEKVPETEDDEPIPPPPVDWQNQLPPD